MITIDMTHSQPVEAAKVMSQPVLMNKLVNIAQDSKIIPEIKCILGLRKIMPSVKMIKLRNKHRSQKVKASSSKIAPPLKNKMKSLIVSIPLNMNQNEAVYHKNDSSTKTADISVENSSMFAAKNILK